MGVIPAPVARPLSRPALPPASGLRRSPGGTDLVNDQSTQRFWTRSTGTTHETADVRRPFACRLSRLTFGPASTRPSIDGCRARRTARHSSASRCATASLPAANGCGRCLPWPPPTPSHVTWHRVPASASDAARCALPGRRRAPRGLRARAHTHLFADSRRPAGHGQRHAPPRPADRACRLRRRHRHPRRRRSAGRRLRARWRASPTSHDPGGRAPASFASFASSPKRPARPEWSAARRLTFRRQDRREDERSRSMATPSVTCTRGRPGRSFAPRPSPAA